MAHDGLGQDSLAGRTLGHYRIVEKIGEGGIGFVYRACDEHLDNRQVAIKILRSGSLADPIARQRFRKEAHTVSKLSHPNIAMVFDFNCEDGTDFLVEEFVEGISLDDMLEHGALAQKEIVALGTQLCEGLAAAHERSVIHRDIKPGNLRVTPDAQLKILDFGLAKHFHPTDEAKKVTASMSETQIVAGTLPYLSPEQIRNEKLDARTDIWAAGCVLYEMATGRRPFLGQSTALIDEILRQTPALPSKLNQKIAPGVDSIILKCLEKDPSLRYASARDVAVDLRRLALTSSSTLVVTGPAKKTNKWPWVVGATVVIALAAGGYWLARPIPQPRIVASHALTNTGYYKEGKLLTSGANLYFTEYRESGPRLTQVSVKGGEATPLALLPAGSDFMLNDIAKDGSELLMAVRWPTSNQYQISSQPLPAGPPRRLIREGMWGIWTPDTRSILFRRGTGLYRSDVDGTKERLLIDPKSLSRLAISPDGTRVRYGIPRLRATWEVGADGSNPHPVLSEHKDGMRSGAWSPDGKYYFFRSFDGDKYNLWAAADSTRGWRIRRAQPIQLTFGPFSISEFAVAADGKEIFATTVEPHGELSVYEPKSGTLVPYLSGISASFVDFSRDGKWITYVSIPEGNLWRSKVDGSERRQLTWPPYFVLLPRWSPDGKLILFEDIANGDRRHMGEGSRLYVVSPDGGEPVLLPAESSEGEVSDATWGPDGREIVYGIGGALTYAMIGLRVFDLKTQKSSKVPGSEGFWSARWSPDGKYLLALSGNPPTRLMLYTFATRQWKQLLGSTIGFPSWTHDSKYVVFEGPQLARVSIPKGEMEIIAPDWNRFRRTSPVIFWDWDWIGLTPDDRVMATRDTSVREIYAFDLEYKQVRR